MREKYTKMYNSKKPKGAKVARRVRERKRETCREKKSYRDIEKERKVENYSFFDIKHFWLHYVVKLALYLS